MKLGLIADTRHYQDEQGRLYALTPVVRQLELWADWFDELVVCAPLLPGPPPGHCSPYRRLKARIRPLRFGGGTTLGAKLGLLGRTAEWWPQIRSTIREVDAVHLRCPCNIGLLGILAVRRTTRPRYVAYCGQWKDYEGEPRTFRLQKRLLGRPEFGGVVAMYGSYPDQPPHVLSSFAPSFTLAEWEAEEPQVRKRLESLALPRSGPVRVLTVGHLDANKNQALVMETVARLRRQGLEVTLECVGEGGRREQLLALRTELGLEDAVGFPGALPYAEVCERYRHADINVLASRGESFGKVLTEGMLHGSVPIAAEMGITPQLLGHGERGLNFPPGDVEGLAEAIRVLGEDPERRAKMVAQGREYARTITLEAYQELTRQALERQWGMTLPRRGCARSATPETPPTEVLEPAVPAGK